MARPIEPQPLRPGLMARLFGRRPEPVRAEPTLSTRSYEMARPSRLASEWTLQTQDPNSALAASLSGLVARARHLARESDHVRGFLIKARNNVIGSAGIRLRVNARRPDGTRDVADSELVEREFADWSRRGVPTTCGRVSFRGLLALALRHLLRDGEFLALLVRGRQLNPWGFAVQVLDPLLLDATYSTRLASGNRVIMGVEVDAGLRPLAYWIKTDRDDALVPALQRRRVRIPADQVLHAFMPADADDVRGVTWFSPTGKRVYQVGKYEEAELVAARVAASKMGFFEADEGAPEYGEPDEEGDGDGDDGADTFVQSTDPGTFEVLPTGYKFKSFDPQHPTTQFGDFLSHQLRSGAAGLGVSYMAFANDLRGVSYSGGRLATLDDRALWQDLQAELVEAVCSPVFRAWCEAALLAGRFGAIPAARADKFVRADQWQPRGFPWSDPQKDISARTAEIALGTTSRRRVAAEAGRDWDDVQAELAAEEGGPRRYATPTAPGAPIAVEVQTED